MKQIVLEVELRQGTGKEVCKRLRKQGRVPAVVYADGKEVLPLTVPALDMLHILHGGGSSNAIINLNIKNDGKTKEKTVEADTRNPITEVK